MSRPRLSETAGYRSFSTKVLCRQFKTVHPGNAFNANFKMALHPGNPRVKRLQEGWGGGSGSEVLIMQAQRPEFKFPPTNVSITPKPG